MELFPRKSEADQLYAQQEMSTKSIEIMMGASDYTKKLWLSQKGHM